MGVPKFYRWISERYPCLSEVVKEYQIPEFDNLYLDMNGIIHTCSHPNDGDPHFRMTEEKMFKDIFHYIEVLFRLIQPKKVFFMAVDGVAPRAKMNQQRGRRFRSAREAVDAEKKARERGESLPKEERFDSNCITPGTEFMARLDAQLQYFVSYKISQDKLWQNCKVIYSGHQTPGEGEHKIMEYIRYSKSQMTYNPNTRHCLYGLDADLIMLGLTSHEPHFSLLREEVRFGGKKDSNNRTPTPEETTFHLLHLSLMREYLNYEFSELQGNLPFPFDLENIIDDWVLMGFLVGNDFIPHLPHLHINKEALPILYKTYKEVLPTLDGYINNGGNLHLARFEKFIRKLAEYEVSNFEETNADLKYFNSKRSGDGSAFPINRGTADARELEPFDFGDDTLDDNDQEFDLCAKLENLGYKPDPAFYDDEEDDDENGTSDTGIFEEEFRQHKREYYITKMHYSNVDSSVLREQATCYVRGIQWILNYYYNGICSWSWYYPYHYSPFMTDIKDFSDMKLEFEMGKPFMPYEQLLAVLPPLSVKLLPQAYRPLMIQPESPLKEFYPETFETDLNGKQQDWEAVVLIPFIDEERLLTAMTSCNKNLTEEEKARNVHGPMYIYFFTPDSLGEYKAPKYFPSVGVNHAGLEMLHRDSWEVLPEKIYKGLCKGVSQDLYFAGFPTLKHVPHKFHVAKENVKVFQQNSRGENYILDVTEPAQAPDLRDLANQILGKTVFVCWPHLVEAKVSKVSNGKECYILSKGEMQKQILEGTSKEEFYTFRNSIASGYHDRWGINIGHTDILVYAAVMTGRNYMPVPNGRLSLEKTWSIIVQPFANQVVVRDIAVHDPGYKQHLTPQEYFPPRTKVFMLGQPHYGCMGEVILIDPDHKGRILVVMTVALEPNFECLQQKQEQLVTRNLTSYQASQKLGVSSHLLARLTGTVLLVPPSGDNPSGLEVKNKLNIGLNLKNNKRNEEVAGYTCKYRDGDRFIWMYQEKTIEAIREYQEKFPEVFDYLSVQIGEKDIFFQDDIFEPENCKERVAELTTWLKESDFAKAERRRCGTQALDESIVSRIVEEVDKASAIRARAVKMQVRPHLLFKPNPLQGSSPPDHTVKYRLFDRVINCREGYSVPLGAKGTVIGIQPAEKEADVIYDILFDEPFIEGMTLGCPKTSKRCYRLHWATMINISHGNRRTSLDDSNIACSGQYNKKQGYVWGAKQASQNQKWRQQPQRQQQEQHQYSNRGNTRELENKQRYSINNQGAETYSPQPPDPNQLPSPSGLCISVQKEAPPSGHANGAVDAKRTFSQHTRQVETSEICSADEVECIVHGTFFASWHKIRQNGITGMNGRSILCYTCVPQGIPSKKDFQLHIHINVTKALEDGIKFHRISKRQAVCSGDRQGVLRPLYFSKVVDCLTNSIIFPVQNAAMRDAANWNSGGIPCGPRLDPVNSNPAQSSGFNSVPQQVCVGRGRGAHSPQGLKLHEFIWSQVQQKDQEVDLRPAQSEALSRLLNISGENSSNSSSSFSSGRVEVSVQDIFRGAVSGGTSYIEPSTINNLNSFSSISVPQNLSTQDVTEKRGKKGDSPAKSAFVPTQVIRNQTPRKPKTDQFREETRDVSSIEEREGFDIHLEKQQSQHPQKQSQPPLQQQQLSHKSNNNEQPKRRGRNRLAVKFGQPFLEDT